MNASADLVLDAMKRDKKREGDTIFFVLLQTLGEAVIEEISLKELEGVGEMSCVTIDSVDANPP